MSKYGKHKNKNKSTNGKTKGKRRKKDLDAVIVYQNDIEYRFIQLTVILSLQMEFHYGKKFFTVQDS